MAEHRVGIEVGGTFTDWVLSTAGNVVACGKVPSTRRTPDVGALAVLGELDVPLQDVVEVVHGSTVATNAIIERTGARTALVATAGFTDLLEIQRQSKQRLFDLRYRHPPPLISRDRVLGANERIDASGAVVLPLDVDDLIARLRHLVERDSIESVAVCLINSYANPLHERQIFEAVRQALPEMFVTLSTDVSPEIREYERMSTAVINAYIRPVIDRYLERFQAGIEATGCAADVSIVQSNGGSSPARQVRGNAARMVLSGPAAGVVGGIRSAARSGFSNLVTMDMGGTSCDAAIVRDGRPAITIDYKVDGLPLQLPMLDIRSVGAGGGSIVTVDGGGLLRIGPESAGSDPGPAAYGNGDDLTITDVNLLLGFIRAETFRVPSGEVDIDRAQAALDCIAGRLGVTAYEAGLGVRQLINTMLAGAVRLVSVEQGHDPADYVLVAFGGGGPLHAAEVADELAMSTVVIPESPGTLSAYGLIVGDRRHDFRTSRIVKLHDLDSTALDDITTDLRASAAREIGDLAHEASWTVTFAVDARYEGQAFQLPVDLTDVIDRTADDSVIALRFHEAHRLRYGHFDLNGVIELVTFGLTATRSGHVAVEVAADSAPPLVDDGSIVEIAEPGPNDCRYLRRQDLRPGALLKGPLLLEEETSSTYVPPLWCVQRSNGNLVLTRG